MLLDILRLLEGNVLCIVNADHQYTATPTLLTRNALYPYHSGSADKQQSGFSVLESLHKAIFNLDKNVENGSHIEEATSLLEVFYVTGQWLIPFPWKRRLST